MSDLNFDQFNSPLSPIRFQAGLGKEMERRYKEGQNVVKLSLARVVKVNYKYNTVDVVTTLYKNSTVKNPTDNGKFSARLPVSFGGTTPEGNVYGSTTLVTVGSLVLIGYLEGNKDHPIVLNIYGETNNQSQLTRTSFSSADASDESIQRELWQLFTLYPSMTFKNIDGHGNQEVTFSGKSFMYITDTDPDNDYVQDAGFDYQDLPSSRYANGDLIEPKSPNSPTVLYVHQGIYDKHRVTFFIKADGTVRLGSRHLDGEGISFMEMTTDGAFQVVRQVGSTNPEESVEKFSKIGLEDNGTVIMKSLDHTLEVNAKGVFIDGKSIASFGGIDDGEGGTISFEDLIDDLEDIKTTITIQNGKIESKISRIEYDIDMEAVMQYAEDLVAGANQDIEDIQNVLDNLEDYVDNAFADGIIEEAEANAIKIYLNTLRKEQLDMDERYLEILNNELLPEANADILTTAKENFNTKFLNLIDIINTVILDHKATEEEREAVDLAFDEYGASVAALSVAFQQAADAIALAHAKSAEGAAIRFTESTFLQLADQISSKVESQEFTDAISNVNSEMATLESNLSKEIVGTNDRIDGIEDELVHKVEIYSTNGLTFTNGIINTTLFAKVYRGKEEITNVIPDNRLVWSRISDDEDGDAVWNNTYGNSGKSVVITGADLNARATFNCTLLDEDLS